MLADGTQWTKRYKDTKHTITKYSKEGKLRKLIKHLADSKNHKYINVQDDAGRTAVNFVASWDCPKTLAKLLRVPDVDVNMRDEVVEFDSSSDSDSDVKCWLNSEQQRKEAAPPIIRYLNREMHKKKHNGCMSHAHSKTNFLFSRVPVRWVLPKEALYHNQSFIVFPYDLKKLHVIELTENYTHGKKKRKKTYFESLFYKTKCT